jgi:uncharacterized membrane protein
MHESDYGEMMGQYYGIMMCILSLMRFLSSNLEIYKLNTSAHNINTRHKLKLHKPASSHHVSDGMYACIPLT